MTCRKARHWNHTRGYCHEVRDLLCWRWEHYVMISQHSHSRLPSWGLCYRPHKGLLLVGRSTHSGQEEDSRPAAGVGNRIQGGSDRLVLD